MDNINILVEAKKEYTSQLQKIITPRIYEGFKSIYDNVLSAINKELDEKKNTRCKFNKNFPKNVKRYSKLESRNN